MKTLHELLDWVSERVAGDSGFDKTRILGILAKWLEGPVGKLPSGQAAQDLVDAGSILLTELTEARKYVGPERAIELCEQVDFDRLCIRQPYVHAWSGSDPFLYTAPEFATRLHELREHLIRNREHLLATGYPVVMPGEAYCLFSSLWWRGFALLYPTKIPVGQSGTLDSSNTPMYSYAWSRRPGKRFWTREEFETWQKTVTIPGCKPDEICDYESAPPMEGMSSEDAARVETLRGKVLELEIGLLSAVQRPLQGDTGECVWELCVPLLKGLGTNRDKRLSAHDIDFLIGVDSFLDGAGKVDPPAGRAFSPLFGAFSLSILLSFYCEWILTSGLHQRMRDLLSPAGLIEEKPLRPPRLSVRSQCQIAGTPAEEALDKAVELHRASANEAASFFIEYYRRVKDLIRHDVPVPIGAEMWVPRGVEKDVRGRLEFFTEAQSSHIEHVGRPLDFILKGASEPAEDLETANVFRKESDGSWTMRFAGTSITIDRKRIGLATIAYLLRNADKDCSVMELARFSAEAKLSKSARQLSRMDGAALAELGLSVGCLGDSGEMLDEEAIAEYRRHRRAILDELDDANHEADKERIGLLKSKMLPVETELSRAVGLRGRRRKADDPFERARKCISNQIHEALDLIEPRHGELHAHLRARLDYAFYVWVYRSVPGVTWET